MPSLAQKQGMRYLPAQMCHASAVLVHNVFYQLVGTRKNLLELCRKWRLKYSMYFFLAWLRKCPRFAARWASNMVSAIFDHGSGAMATAISYRNIGILL